MILGLHFNLDKCKTIFFIKGSHVKKFFLLDNKVISSLSVNEYEKYLGIPIGAKLLFRTVNLVKSNLAKITDSLLTPPQKLEVLPSYIIPSLSHVLSSRRVVKTCLYDLDNHIRNFLRYFTNTPVTTALPFIYAERYLGGLAYNAIFGLFRRHYNYYHLRILSVLT